MKTTRDPKRRLPSLLRKGLVALAETATATARAMRTSYKQTSLPEGIEDTWELDLERWINSPELRRPK